MAITTAVPPRPHEIGLLLKAELFKRRPLQAKVMRYLSQNRRSSINGLACDLGRDRGSIQRCLKVLKGNELVQDEWSYFSSLSTPRTLAHYFTLTGEGKSTAGFLASAPEQAVEVPLGFRILRFFSSFKFFTVYMVSKLLGKPQGHVRRVMLTLARHCLADYAVAGSGEVNDVKGKRVLWWITDEGRILAHASIEEYNHRVHRCKGREHCKHRPA